MFSICMEKCLNRKMANFIIDLALAFFLPLYLEFSSFYPAVYMDLSVTVLEKDDSSCH